MRLAVHSATTQVAKNLHVRDGTTKSALRMWIRDNGALKQFFGQFAVSVSSTDAEGFAASSLTRTITTSPTTVTAIGAVGTITYAWTRTDGGSHAWTINNPSSATTTFSTLCGAGSSVSATFDCVVTDSAGQSATTATVTATCENDYQP
jgi:hypothetical protein